MASSALVASFSFAFLRKATGYMSRFLRIEMKPLNVLVTGAAGKIGNALVPMIARGLMLGADQPVILHMLDTDDKALEEFKKELIDAAFPLLFEVHTFSTGVVATTVPEEDYRGVDVAVMIDVESESTSKDQASASAKHADKNCKVLVVADPAKAKKNLREIFAGQKNIQPKNITYLTRLEHNRALGRISQMAGVRVSDVKNVIIREKDKSTLNVDVDHAIVTTSNGGKSVREFFGNDKWLSELHINSRTRKQSSALWTASSACDHVRDWLLGTPEGTWVSMGVYYAGSYGSFPVTCDGNGKWFITEFDETTKKPIMDKKKKKALELS
ncbi:malate dehydrogenase, cytoplasmic isoform X3 [Ziziphus jujuba]|uniref:Malate dehydrogenase, cytoplasmic isoform X3 n=1 Tax=Ziziphus jujuba TaxID=326968 RepID=A0A6P6GEK0_ZIZJJ|nr:malate dehydrogenase, cytoplasmic isoform X3 [Ziziphus jujuba]